MVRGFRGARSESNGDLAGERGHVVPEAVIENQIDAVEQDDASADDHVRWIDRLVLDGEVERAGIRDDDTPLTSFSTFQYAYPSHSAADTLGKSLW